MEITEKIVTKLTNREICGEHGIERFFYAYPKPGVFMENIDRLTAWMAVGDVIE